MRKADVKKCTETASGRDAKIAAWRSAYLRFEIDWAITVVERFKRGIIEAVVAERNNEIPGQRYGYLAAVARLKELQNAK